MNLPINKIICGDCLKIMVGWPDNCVDLILTDPPYGVGVKYDEFDDTKANVRKLARRFVKEACRIAKVVAFTCGNDNVHSYPPSDWILAWFYDRGAVYCSWGFNCWQPILCYGKDPYLRDGLGARRDSFIMNSPLLKKEKILNKHPCPRSIEPIKWMIERFSTSSDDLILDPFCGSGTTCVASKMSGRRFIGIDISEKYCDIARKRLKGVIPTLFEKPKKMVRPKLFENKRSKK